MNTLLVAVNAKYIHSNLAVYSLEGYAAKCGYPVEIQEFTINQNVDYAISEIYKKQPELLCLSCYIWNISFMEQVITELHKLMPHLPIWVGGPEVSYEKEIFLRHHPGVTGIMYGEGEQTFVQLLEYYQERTKVPAGDKLTLGDILGISFLEEESYWDTGVRPAMNMDDIPFPYDNMEAFKNRIVYYESSRGCPFRCSYCLSSLEKSLRFRSVSLVKKELQFFIDHQVPQVKFVDRTFNCDHEHAMAVWKYIREADQGITNFHFEIAADLLTAEEITFLNSLRPGLIQLEIGVQSTNEKTITEIRRTMDLKRLENTTKAVLQGENIHQHLDLIAGLPFEDINSFANSFDTIYALKPNQLQMGFLKVLKGSYMYDMREEYGLIYKSTPQYEVLSTRWLSYSDVIRLKRIEEMLEVYYNSGQFLMAIKVLETAYDSAFLMFDALGDYYEKQGLFLKSHNRNQRGQILMDFVDAQGMLEHQLMAEALTFDIYWRENAKSRPTFAPFDIISKEAKRRLETKGKLMHVETFSYLFPGKEVATLAQAPVKGKPYYVRFDYEHRNPLDHQARYEILQISEVDS